MSPTTIASSAIAETNSSQGDGSIEKTRQHDGQELEDDAYFDRLFDSLVRHSGQNGDDDNNEKEEGLKLVDFIEETVGIKGPRNNGDKRIRGRAKPRENDTIMSSAGYTAALASTALELESDNISEGSHLPPSSIANQFATYMSSETLQSPPKIKSSRFGESPHMSPMATIMEEQPPPSVNEKRDAPYNVVCTHITADFDTLASAIGLAKLWSLGIYDEDVPEDERGSVVHGPLPTYVVLPRGAHPDVHRFLSLHKHLFPIRSLKSLPGFTETELKKVASASSNGNPTEGLQRVGLVDAQRRDRLGPADILLPHAKLGVTIVDHHVDAESDIEEARHFVVDRVGSVSTMIAERLRNKGVEMTEAEATILALGIHSDTGSLVYDSTTPKDAMMLGWAMEMGASQTAIAEHAIPTLSAEQQGVLTQALMNINSINHHGVTISTVLLSADGFIPGLAAVTKDALDLSCSDIFLLAVCYEATRGDGGGGGGRFKGKNNNNSSDVTLSKYAKERLQQARRKTVKAIASHDANPGVAEVPPLLSGVAVDRSSGSHMINSESWKGGEVAFHRQRLAATFAFYDTDRSGFLSKDEIFQALTAAGFLINQSNFDILYSSMDIDSNGKIDFEEFVYFYNDMEEQRKLEALCAGSQGKLPSTPSTMTIIGRVKAGVNVRNVNLNTLFQKFNGGGHPKAASATAKLENESEAKKVLQDLVDELIDASLDQQLTVGDFMQSPVLSARPSMTEKQVEDLFIRYDVRALPVVDDDNCVIGLVSYKEVAAAKMRLLNKQEKRLRQMEKAVAEDKYLPVARPLESALKGWMKQHVQTVEASQTMAEVENILLEADVGCIPVVMDNTKQLIGMVTRTDLLRQHRYYSSLHYHNKGFSDSIAARKPIIELRKKLKKFDVE